MRKKTLLRDWRLLNLAVSSHGMNSFTYMNHMQDEWADQKGCCADKGQMPVARTARLPPLFTAGIFTHATLHQRHYRLYKLLEGDIKLLWYYGFLELGPRSRENVASLKRAAAVTSIRLLGVLTPRMGPKSKFGVRGES